jgi:hypothetical protein
MARTRSPVCAMTTHKTYEWSCEKLDAHGDVADVEYAATRVELPASGPLVNIALVCGTWRRGVVSRSWAYVDPGDGSLMKWFTETGNADDKRTGKVPKRFHDELATKKKPTKKKPTKPACEGCALPNECQKCERFVCAGCERVTPWAEGADDDAPDLCDVCWCKVNP